MEDITKFRPVQYRTYRPDFERDADHRHMCNRMNLPDDYEGKGIFHQWIGTNDLFAVVETAKGIVLKVHYENVKFYAPPR